MADGDDITVVAAVCLQYIVIVSASILLRRKRRRHRQYIGSNRGYESAMSVERITHSFSNFWRQMHSRFRISCEWILWHLRSCCLVLRSGSSKRPSCIHTACPLKLEAWLISAAATWLVAAIETPASLPAWMNTVHSRRYTGRYFAITGRYHCEWGLFRLTPAISTARKSAGIPDTGIPADLPAIGPMH